MTPCRCLMLLTLALASFGCATRAPVSAPGAEFRTGLTLEPGHAQQFGYATRWVRSITLDPGQTVLSARVLDDLLVTVERPRNVVTAIKIQTGELVWKMVIGDPLEQLYAANGDEDYLYINSGRRLFTIDRRRGEQVRVDNLGYSVNMSPLLYKDFAIFGSVNGRIFAFDVKAGFSKWAYALSSKITATPVRDGRQVFVADTAGKYVMLVGDTGEMRWHGSAYGPITTAPVRDRAFMVVASEDQSLYSLVATTGRQRWPAFRSEAPLTETPVIIGRTIYLVEPNVGLTAINSNTGKTLWSIPDLRVPLTKLGEHLLTHNNTSLAKLDPATGQTLAAVPTQPLDLVVTGPDESLILVARDGEILRIDPR